MFTFLNQIYKYPRRRFYFREEVKKIKRKRKILRGQPGIFLFLEDECNKQFGKKPKGRGKARKGSTCAEDLLKVSSGFLRKHARNAVTMPNPIVKKFWISLTYAATGFLSSRKTMTLKSQYAWSQMKLKSERRMIISRNVNKKAGHC